MKNANLYGFSTENDGLTNAKILQELVNGGGEIAVETEGIYDISETVEIGDNTTLRFAKGVQIRRQPSSSDRNGMLLINKGIATHTYNENIKIIGLHIDCNNVESDDWGADSLHVGLRAHVGMIYIKNLTVEDFECIGVQKCDYGIQISAFENIHLENLYITGDKDGIHLGWGKGFTIRNGKFCTFDDPIALNAFDYATSNTHVGWIEDGIVEDCYDLNAEETTGFFCRLLGGAWCDWFEGMKVQHSDTVCSCGRVYRVIARPDGEVYTSSTPPSHEFGVKTYNGIVWACVRDEGIYDCGCRNIVLRNIHLQKKRHSAIGLSLNYDVYARSYYPGCKLVAQENISFENIFIENEVKYLIESNHPTKDIRIKNTDMKNSAVYFMTTKIDGMSYPEADITLENVVTKPDSIIGDEGHPYHITVINEKGE